MVDTANLDSLSEEQQHKQQEEPPVEPGDVQAIHEVLVKVRSALVAEALSEFRADSPLTALCDALHLPQEEAIKLGIGVVPGSFDADQFFAKAILDCVECQEKRGPGRPPKRRRKTPTERAEMLRSAREQLRACAHPGSIAIAFLDREARIVSIHFTQADGSSSAHFSPTGSPGALVVGESGSRTALFDDWRDALALRALQLQEPDVLDDYRIVVTDGTPLDVGSLRTLARPPMIVPSQRLADLLKLAMTIHVPTAAPAVASLREFIDGHATTMAAAAGVLFMMQNTTVLFRPIECVREELDQIRRNRQGRKPFEVDRDAAEVVRADVMERGILYHDDQDVFVFLCAEKKLVVVDPENRPLEDLFFAYGLLMRDEISLRVVDTICIRGRQDGLATVVHIFCYYDRDRHVLYLNNFAQQVHRISADRIELVDNGTDGVLFLEDHRMEPYVVSSPTEPRATPALDELFASVEFAPAALSSEDQRTLFRLWFFSLFFPELFSTKAILVFFGERGSRKTSTLRRVGCLLFGSAFNVTPVSHDSKDFDAAVTQTHFVVLDNADSRVPWLEDRLATAATGGRLKLRKLYTTMTMVEYQIRAFLALTSRTPHFRREDVADRLLLLQPQRVESFVSESELLRAAIGRRDEAMTEIVDELQQIVRILKNAGESSERTKFRMADFAIFAMKIARADGWEARMRSILDRAVQDQASFGLEGEPIFELLQDWVYRVSAGRDGLTNAGREVTSRQLCDELSKIAEWRKIDFYLSGKTRAFAQRLRNLLPALRRFFEITEREGQGHRRYFTFKPLPELTKSLDQSELFTKSDDDGRM